MEKKILIAFDDSENSMKAVKMVAESFTKDHRITILSIIPNTTSICNMYSPELTPHFMAQQSVFCAMEEKNKELLQNAQQKAKAILVENGFVEENIVLKLEAAIKGVARDIVTEAQSGYVTVVLGRRGLSGIKEFFIGSVSQKVISQVNNISVFVVD